MKTLPVDVVFDTGSTEPIDLDRADDSRRQIFREASQKLCSLRPEAHQVNTV
jgi:hypothetical protein